MSTSVKERIKSEIEQAKVSGKQRAARIGDILKAAASMTFEEIKDGSADLQVLTRKSVAELLEELEEIDLEANETIADIDSIHEAEAVSGTPFEGAADTPINTPTWKELIRQALAIVRDRRGDWLQQLKDHWNENVVKFDDDMTDEYGDRYLKVKSVFRQVVTWFESVQSQARPTPNTQDEHRPVSIEVMDGDETSEERTVTLLKPELQDEQA